MEWQQQRQLGGGSPSCDLHHLWGALDRQLAARGLGFSDICNCSDRPKVLRSCGLEDPLHIAVLESDWDNRACGCSSSSSSCCPTSVVVGAQAQQQQSRSSPLADAAPSMCTAERIADLFASAEGGVTPELVACVAADVAAALAGFGSCLLTPTAAADEGSAASFAAAPPPPPRLFATEDNRVRIAPRHEEGTSLAGDAAITSSSTYFRLHRLCPKPCLALYDKLLRTVSQLWAIEATTESLRLDTSESRILDGFAEAASEELQQIFSRSESVIAAMGSKPLTALAPIQSAIAPVQRAIAELHRLVCDVAFGVSGAQLLSVLFDEVHGTPDVRVASGVRACAAGGEAPSVAARLLCGAAAPLAVSVAQWVSRGVLEDPLGEFFVSTSRTSASLASIVSGDKVHVAGSPFVGYLRRCPRFLRRHCSAILRCGAYLAMLTAEQQERRGCESGSGGGCARPSPVAATWEEAFAPGQPSEDCSGAEVLVVHGPNGESAITAVEGLGGDLLEAILTGEIDDGGEGHRGGGVSDSVGLGRFAVRLHERLRVCSSALMQKVFGTPDIALHVALIEECLLGLGGLWDAFFVENFDAVCVGALSSERIGKFAVDALNASGVLAPLLALPGKERGLVDESPVLMGGARGGRCRRWPQVVVVVEGSRAPAGEEDQREALVREEAKAAAAAGGRTDAGGAHQAHLRLAAVVAEALHFVAEQSTYCCSTLACVYTPPQHIALCIPPEAAKKLAQCFSVMSRLRWVRCFLAARQREALLQHRNNGGVNPSLVHLIATAGAISGQLLAFWGATARTHLAALRFDLGLERRAPSSSSLMSELTIEEAAAAVSSFAAKLVQLCFLASAVRDSPVYALVGALERISVTATAEAESQLVAALRRCSLMGEAVGFASWVDFGNHYRIHRQQS